MAELDDVRQQLELEKLRREIGDLKHKWWLPPLVQAVPTFLVSVAALAIALYTGVLDAKRENIAAQNERLEIRRSQLEKDKDLATAQLVDLQKQVELANNQLKIDLAEKNAIRALRRSPIAGVGFVQWIEDSENGEYLLTLTGDDPKSMVQRAIGPDEPPLDELIRQALVLARDFKSLHRLEIKFLPMSIANLKLIGELSELRSLVLDSNELGNQAMKEFPHIPKLTSIYLERQQFTEADGLKQMDRLIHVGFFSTPVGASVFRCLGGSKKTLQYLTLRDVKLNQEDATAIAEFSGLHVDLHGNELKPDIAKLMLQGSSAKLWIWPPHSPELKDLRREFGRERLFLVNDSQR